MTATVRTLPPNARVQDAVIEFTRGRYRHLPVLEGDRLVGIVSDRDVLRVVASESHDPNGPISRIMSHRPTTVGPESSLADAIRQLLHHRIGCLPVVTGSNVFEGILTTTDLLRALYAVQYWLERQADDDERGR
jgi:acetoin utilization protein AcuB